MEDFFVAVETNWLVQSNIRKRSNSAWSRRFLSHPIGWDAANSAKYTVDDGEFDCSSSTVHKKTSSTISS